MQWKIWINIGGGQHAKFGTKRSFLKKIEKTENKLLIHFEPKTIPIRNNKSARISGKAVNIPTVPHFIANSFLKKKTLKT